MSDKKIQVEYISIDELEPYARNPRDNSGAVQYVANSIREFGFRNPIILGTGNVIIAGHTRLLAAKSLGMSVVPCVRADDLTEEQQSALRIADNKTAEFAEWDEELLAGELSEICDIDMSDFGILVDEVENGEQKTERGDVEFTKELLLTHNYIVLYFDNDFDWSVAVDKFKLTKVKDLIPRKGQPTGIGRVIDGKEVLEWLN